MSHWDPQIYARFESERNRPVEDLIARIPPGTRNTIVDLGCGSGLSTQSLRRKYAGAKLAGIDTSEEMLDAARQRLPEVEFAQANVSQWRGGPADLLFANALFQWVPHHIEVLSQLCGELAPSGCLAVQMPDNENEPSHALMREVAQMAPFRGKLARVGEARDKIGDFSAYNAALAPLCPRVDIWRTTYVHRLAGHDAIVAWVEGAGLRPYLAPLTAEERSEFLAIYRGEIVKAYPVRDFGGVLLPFPRLFIVAERAAMADRG